MLEDKQHKIKGFIIFAVRGITKRKLRSWLTMIGIIIGVMAVITLVSLGQGLQNTINSQFAKAGANRIVISPGGSISPVGGSSFTSVKLTENDVEAVQKVQGVDFAAGIITGGSTVKFRDETKAATIFGISPDSKTTSMIEDISFFTLESGHNPRPGDQYKAVLGNDVATKYFKREIKVGDTITLYKKEFEVIGIQKHAGTYIHDQIIRMPKDTLRELTNDTTENVDTIFALTTKGIKPSQVAEQIKKELRKERNVKEGKEDFTVQTSESLVKSFNSIFNIVQFVLIGLASISVLVGGVGIMNTMYTSIMERTREIGIMKAVGARNSDIMLIFLIESGTLGLVGGGLGVLIGMAIAKAIELIAASIIGSGFLIVSFSPLLVIGALLFSLFAGAAAGLMPALQAARMEPVDALKH